MSAEGGEIAHAGAGADAALAQYYDRLSRFVNWARLGNYGGGRAELAMHRALAPPGSRAPPSHELLDSLLIARLSPQRDPDVLDAGCGFGGTIFRWHRNFGGRYDGLTLSPVQADVARSEAARQGCAHACRFHVRSYDLPPLRYYDVILAIESLVHSRDVVKSVKSLAATLKPGGRVAIVDDVPDAALGEGDRDLAKFQRGWRCPALPRSDDYARAFAAAGLTIEDGEDLTAWLRPRTAARLDVLIALNRLIGAFTPSNAARAVLESYQGGLALERLYRRGAMAYRMMVARRVQ